MPSVIPKAKEANIVPRSPYPRTIKPEKQAMAISMAHYPRRAILWKKSFGEGVSPDVMGAIVVATTFIAPHQTGRIYVEKTPE